MSSLYEVQSYWDRRPCNIRHGTAPIGTRDYFDQVEARKYRVEPHIPGFAEFEKWKGKRVLEIGCGIGTDAVNFVRAGADYTGIELSSQSLQLAERRMATFSLSGRFIQGNAEELLALLPSDERPFDLIYSFGVLHHTPQPERALDSVKRFMHRGSELRLMLYATHSWKKSMIDAGLDQPEAQSGCPIARTYSHEEIKSLLRGYRIESLTQDHIFPYVIEKYVQHEYEIDPRFKDMSPEAFRALEQDLGWHTLIQAKLA
jgi:ubiquinone/menaquinone biosynthesis C-methylase UbiE